jgi:hypothetical protein
MFHSFSSFQRLVYHLDKAILRLAIWEDADRCNCLLRVVLGESARFFDATAV